jgi:predicted amidohydrolase YtcJ
MIVLDKDIFTCERDERESASVNCTIAWGRITYGNLGG